MNRRHQQVHARQHPSDEIPEEDLLNAYRHPEGTEHACARVRAFVLDEGVQRSSSVRRWVPTGAGLGLAAAIAWWAVNLTGHIDTPSAVTPMEQLAKESSFHEPFPEMERLDRQLAGVRQNVRQVASSDVWGISQRWEGLNTEDQGTAPIPVPTPQETIQ